MLSADTSALVAGSPQAPAAAGTAVTLRVLRGVMVAGQRVEPGAQIAVDKWFAAELVSAGKAERVAAPAATEPKPAAKAAERKTRAQQ
jgi:hypothetical protein